MTMWVYTTKKVSELLKSSFILPKFNSHLDFYCSNIEQVFPYLHYMYYKNAC